MHQTRPVVVSAERETAGAQAVRLNASSSLHRAAGLQNSDTVSGYAVFVDLAIHKFVAVWVTAGEVEEVDACEDDEEATEQGEGVDGVGGTEAAEEEEGGAEGCGSEGHVVEGVYAG
jgi:hypothetical protein